jgi:hypothetical protein
VFYLTAKSKFHETNEFIKQKFQPKNEGNSRFCPFLPNLFIGKLSTDSQNTKTHEPSHMSRQYVVGKKPYASIARANNAIDCMVAASTRLMNTMACQMLSFGRVAISLLVVLLVAHVSELPTKVEQRRSQRLTKTSVALQIASSDKSSSTTRLSRVSSLLGEAFKRPEQFIFSLTRSIYPASNGGQKQRIRAGGEVSRHGNRRLGTNERERRGRKKERDTSAMVNVMRHLGRVLGISDARQSSPSTNVSNLLDRTDSPPSVEEDDVLRTGSRGSRNRRRPRPQRNQIGSGEGFVRPRDFADEQFKSGRAVRPRDFRFYGDKPPVSDDAA